MLSEAAFVAVSTPGPMRAFYERVRARRGSQIAIVAVARKLAVLFWHLLTREQDYAFARPSLTRRSSAPSNYAPAPNGTQEAATSRPRTPTASAHTANASANSPNRPSSPTAGSSPTGSQRPSEGGCGRDTGARISRALERPSRATDSVKPQTSALRFVSHPHPTTTISKEPSTVQST